MYDFDQLLKRILSCQLKTTRRDRVHENQLRLSSQFMQFKKALVMMYVLMYIYDIDQLPKLNHDGLKKSNYFQPTK